MRYSIFSLTYIAIRRYQRANHLFVQTHQAKTQSAINSPIQLWLSFPFASQDSKRHAARAAAHAPPNLPNAAHGASKVCLQDAISHANTENKPQYAPSAIARGLNGLGTTGPIIPGLLAKYHPPRILLDHLPLAIHHIRGVLSISVPGFACISPTNAGKKKRQKTDSSCFESLLKKWGRVWGWSRTGMLCMRNPGWEHGMLGKDGKYLLSVETFQQKNKVLQQAGHHHSSELVLDLTLSQRNSNLGSGQETVEADWQKIGALKRCGICLAIQANQFLIYICHNKR